MESASSQRPGVIDSGPSIFCVMIVSYIKQGATRTWRFLPGTLGRSRGRCCDRVENGIGMPCLAA